MGSSPQVRGPLLGPAAVTASNGLIPAGAGTTLLPMWKAGADAAHPRRCGDHSEFHEVADKGVGSSPQVRGPRRVPDHTDPRMRLIPAGAGTT